MHPQTKRRGRRGGAPVRAPRPPRGVPPRPARGRYRAPAAPQLLPAARTDRTCHAPPADNCPSPRARNATIARLTSAPPPPFRCGCFICQRSLIRVVFV